MINEVMKNNEKVVEFVIHKEAKEFLSKLDKKKVNNYKYNKITKDGHSDNSWTPKNG
jgi:hypothetical protein